MELGGQLHAPAALPLKETAIRTHSTGGWMSLKPSIIYAALLCARNFRGALIIQSRKTHLVDKDINFKIIFNFVRSEAAAMLNSLLTYRD
jgi:hypothetical protein